MARSASRGRACLRRRLPCFLSLQCGRRTSCSISIVHGSPDSSFPSPFPSSPASVGLPFSSFSLLLISPKYSKTKTRFASYPATDSPIRSGRMRYENWDVLLFPETSKVPLQEFKTQCFVTKDTGGLHPLPDRRKVHTDSLCVQNLHTYIVRGSSIRPRIICPMAT